MATDDANYKCVVLTTSGFPVGHQQTMGLGDTQKRQLTCRKIALDTGTGYSRISFIKFPFWLLDDQVFLRSPE